jgi:hypothetical protein
MKIILRLLLGLLVFPIFTQAQSYPQDIDLYLDVYRKPKSSSPVAGTSFNDKFVFSVTRDTERQLWITDGSSFNTYLLYNSNLDAGLARFSVLKSNSEYIYFVLLSSQGYTLFRSDGTRNPPKKIFTLNQSGLEIDKLFPTKTGVYFTVSRSGCPTEFDLCHKLMYSNGTSEPNEVIFPNLSAMTYTIKNVTEINNKTSFFISSANKDEIYTEISPAMLRSTFIANKQSIRVLHSTPKSIYFAVKENG